MSDLKINDDDNWRAASWSAGMYILTHDIATRKGHHQRDREKGDRQRSRGGRGLEREGCERREGVVEGMPWVRERKGWSVTMEFSRVMGYVCAVGTQVLAWAPWYVGSRVGEAANPGPPKAKNMTQKQEATQKGKWNTGKGPSRYQSQREKTKWSHYDIVWMPREDRNG